MKKTGIYFIDSTLIKVCHIKREKQHKVFDGLAKKSKSTTGWLCGFKLVINGKGEIMAFKLTEAITSDKGPVEDLTQDLIGKFIGGIKAISKSTVRSII